MSPRFKLPALAALFLSLLLLQAKALDFSVDMVNCTQLDWNTTLTQTDWSVASYVELFFVSTQGARDYSLLYSALNGGAFPTPGAYEKITMFGDTMLSGTYRIGVGLAAMDGAILTTTTSNGGSEGTMQVTAVDPRHFNFVNCTAGEGTVAESPYVAASSTSSVASATFASTASAPMLTTVPTSSANPSSPTTSTSATAAVSSHSASTTIAVSRSHNGVHKGAIAGAVIGGVVLLLFAFAWFRWYTSRRRTRRLSLAGSRKLSTTSSPSFEKQVGSVSPLESQVCEVPRVSFDVATLERLSESFRRGRSDSQTMYPADPDAGQAKEPEIPIVQIPNPLSSATRQQDISASPYLDLSRTLSTPHQTLSFSVDNLALPIYPTDLPLLRQTQSRSRSAGITPQTSPTTTTFETKSVRPSRSHTNFKIPRVSVPAYTDTGEAGDVGLGERGQAMSRQSSRSRRGSVGGATFFSMEEDPFVDAVQEHEVLEEKAVGTRQV